MLATTSRTLPLLRKELSKTIADMTTQMKEEVSKARDSDRAETEELRGRYAALEAAADAKVGEEMMVPSEGVCLAGERCTEEDEGYADKSSGDD